MLKNSKIIFFIILVILIILTSINIFIEPEVGEVTKIILNKELNFNQIQEIFKLNDNEFTNWDDYWLINFERLNIFFEYLYSIKGLSTNSITSYKDDFKNICLYVWDKNWFIENIGIKKKLDYSKINSRKSITDKLFIENFTHKIISCLLYTSPSPRDRQ